MSIGPFSPARLAPPAEARVTSPHRSSAARARVRRRQRHERLFRACGAAAISLGLVFVVALFFSILSRGYTAFQQTQLKLDLDFSPAALGLSSGAASADQLGGADYAAVIRQALAREFPEVTERRERRELSALVSSGAPHQLRELALVDPSLIGSQRSLWLTADDEVDLFVKGSFDRTTPEAQRRIKDRQIAWIDRLESLGRVRKSFNSAFFSAGDSREPELAGLGAALMGSVYTLLLTLLMSFPLGVGAALYLEEFAPRSRWLDLIEVAINNLAAVPSIVFGLLGLALFINFFDLPRSSALVASLVLTLMTLPVIIIASRAALRSVPPSIRQAALGMGASRRQTVQHHVLPLALPGMLTGAIVGMARALGETAPLLMIGMVAFLVEVPRGFTEPATLLPVQIYLWADSPERAFAERTAAAILVLLAFLMLMNSLAVVLRQRFERRW
ncbi:MAG TPA: phosphate ABC transporter permease PstA [Polyangiaceae bacterium]|jgi:phosphate transport system permease protein|nr:phosphate ABC transporter permease PstA [Polyangiaceae bacterium]